jgi:hypothetical protein
MAKAKERVVAAKPQEVEFNVEIDDGLDRLRRRVDRLDQLIRLNAPEVIIGHEVRMIAYGAHVVAGAVDDMREEKEVAEAAAEKVKRKSK